MTTERSISSSLVGRGDDLVALEEALDRARGGQLVTMVLAGEAGIGKTRLVEEFSERAFAQGARLLTGACVDVGDAALPYGGVMDALRAVPPEAFDALPAALRRALATLVPEAAPDDRPHDGGRGAIFGGALRLLEHLGREEPVVLVLEDLHWADGSTEALLRFLVRGLRQTAVLLVLTYRSDELDRRHHLRGLLAELGRAPRVRIHALRPLTRAETAHQLAELAGAPLDDATIDAIHGRAEGNPFFAEELFAAAAGGGTVPQTLRDTLLARLDSLPAASQAVARVAAACGRHVDHDLLAATCPLGDDALDDALRQCVTGHVLAVDPGGRGYRFRHALLQEVALGELLPGERRRLHERIADVLAAREPQRGTAGARQLAEIAYHRLQAVDRPAALAAAVRAARAAEDVHALAEAARGYDVALELWELVDDPEGCTGVDLPFVLERAAECRWLGFGESDLSPRLRDRASAELGDGASRLRRAEHLSRLATTSCYAHISAGLPLHEQALRLLDDRPSAIAARVRARYACVLMLRGDYALADRVAGVALETARAAGAPTEEADALITRAVCAGERGDVDAALSLLAQARPLVQSAEDLRVLQRYYTNSSHLHVMFGRYDDAVAVVREGVEAELRAGLDRQGRAGVTENGAWALCLLGRPDEAREILGEDVGTVNPETTCLHVRLAHVDLLRGELAAAFARLARARAIRSLESSVVVPICALQVEAALWSGDLPAALEAAEAGEAALVEEARSDAVPLLTLAVRAQADGVRAGLLSPDAARAEADRLLARLRRIAGPGPHALPELEQLLRLAPAERSRLDDAPDADAWRATAEGWERWRRPYDHAYARWRLAEVLAARREGRDEVEQALRSAHAGATSVGATHLAEAIGALARRARVALPGDDGAGTRPFADLTPREREVLALLAHGRTNRQIAETLFITTKTASVHVSNILGKLGAANRGEASAIAHRAGMAGTFELAEVGPPR